MLIAYHRGRLPADNGISGGLMAATGLSAEEATQRVQGTLVVLACDNSPTSTTVSGAALFLCFRRRAKGMRQLPHQHPCSTVLIYQLSCSCLFHLVG